MSLTDILDLFGSLLLIGAAVVWVFAILGAAAALTVGGLLILGLSVLISHLAKRRGDGE